MVILYLDLYFTLEPILKCFSCFPKDGQNPNSASSSYIKWFQINFYDYIMVWLKILKWKTQWIHYLFNSLILAYKVSLMNVIGYCYNYASIVVYCCYLLLPNPNCGELLENWAKLSWLRWRVSWHKFLH